MGDKPVWEKITSSFIQHYYQLFDSNRTQLGTICNGVSCLTWEGQQVHRKAATVEKFITAQHHQPTPDSCIISMVVGQPIMGFHQMFQLKNINDAWVCTNNMFRKALRNFS
uniref:NTF2 domain-containing protein n=1 Tax=Cebus imitator TaxID=2715852 RepID=A0A2K5QFV9_CEBIM